MSETPVLKVEELKTYFYSSGKKAFIRSVDGVTLRINQGETLGIVGESGSGKSVTAQSIMGLIEAAPGVISGAVEFKSSGMLKSLLHNLDNYVKVKEIDGMIMALQKDNGGWQKKIDRVMKEIRGREISMIFQDAKASMNPFMTVGSQITESILLNTEINQKKEAREKALYWLEKVRIDSPALRYNTYPYGLSGGMCQRVMIAMALASEPSLLIADEPTTGLDATIQSKIVDLLAELKSTLGITTMLISHDINTISRLSDRVAVMYGGKVMESGPARGLLSTETESKHPYTAALLASIPTEKHINGEIDLQAIEGDVLDTINIPNGCRFYARCNRINEKVREKCRSREPELRAVSPGHEVRCWLYNSESREPNAG
ncbi:MAG: ABC transporter ATP-binding protein [Deltaproteobacteria bacterium]|nr:ABC transporter ATP-binding protein [Deltaproteobacteria bacterium]